MTAKKRGCESAINAEGQQQAKLPAEMISKQQNKPAAETPLAFIENNLQIQDKAGHLVPLHFKMCIRDRGRAVPILRSLASSA